MGEVGSQTLGTFVIRIKNAVENKRHRPRSSVSH
jgi:hypothetical protein